VTHTHTAITINKISKQGNCEKKLHTKLHALNIEKNIYLATA